MPLGDEGDLQGRLVQAEDFEIPGPQVPHHLEVGQLPQHLLHRGGVGLGLLGLGDLPVLSLPGQLNLPARPFQGNGADFAGLESKHLFGLDLPGLPLDLLPPQAHVGRHQNQEDHGIGNQPTGVHFLDLRSR